MSEITLPKIFHATTTLNERNRVVIQMDDGWVFWDRQDYISYTDEEGNSCDPPSEEIAYYCYGVYGPTTNFNNRIMVVAEEDVPSYRIFGTITIQK